jgi:hypothetical protein
MDLKKGYLTLNSNTSKHGLIDLLKQRQSIKN